MLKQLTVNAKLGVVATLVNNQNHDEKESAGKHGKAHSHRHLFKQRHTEVESHSQYVIVITFAFGIMIQTHHKHSAL